MDRLRTGCRRLPSCPALLAKRGRAILRLRRLETHHVEAVARHRADARLPDVEARLFRTSSFRPAVRTTLARCSHDARTMFARRSHDARTMLARCSHETAASLARVIRAMRVLCSCNAYVMCVQCASKRQSRRQPFARPNGVRSRLPPARARPAADRVAIERAFAAIRSMHPRPIAERRPAAMTASGRANAKSIAHRRAPRRSARCRRDVALVSA
ncbi:MOSC domain protein [Burkholderia thailandensis USAMRU Malaysia |nr:MOSC domain protein [Burkholderia thailandensis USAMRU Malaysia \